MIRVLALAMLLVWTARAERLPAKIYTTADGLAHNSIHRIMRDSFGLLWFATSEGVSRFDGYTFTNYGKAEGLPHPNVWAMIEAGPGEYWVGTGGGLCRFDRKSNACQVVALPAELGTFVRALERGRDGTIWVATRKGLGRSAGWGGFEVVKWDDGTKMFGDVKTILEDAFETLWIGGDGVMYRRWKDGRVERYSPPDWKEEYWVNSLREDKEHRIVAATHVGVILFTPLARGTTEDRCFPRAPGARADYLQDALARRDGTWLVHLNGIRRLFPEKKGEAAAYVPVAADFGLKGYPLETIAEDRAGNLWIGSDGGGVARVANNGLVSYGTADGLGAADVISLFENEQGKLHVVSRADDALYLNLFGEKGFQAVRVNLNPQVVSARWRGRYEVMVQSGPEEWWVGTNEGLARFRGIRQPSDFARARPEVVSDDNVFRLYRDRGGRLWVSAQFFEGNVVQVRDAAGRLDKLRPADGAPDLRNDRMHSFTEDFEGNLWVGLRSGGLWRRSGGKFRHFSGKNVPEGQINWLFTDRGGRVWMGTSAGGAARIDAPGSENPEFVRYTMREGLSSDEVQCITEDGSGRIYLGTGRGVDRLDPNTGYVKHYTTADGLAEGELQTAFRDRMGRLWFGTQKGLSRLDPEDDRTTAPPAVRLMAIHAGGDSLALPPAGETGASLPDLLPGRDQVELEFAGISAGAGDVPRYQYRLEGATEEWSKPSLQRSVVYAGLRAGRYRFVVRALNAGGMAGPEAFAGFRILPPVWLRWWFLTAMAAVMGLGVFWALQYREKQRAAVRKVRTRIATDLHDDIGSSLSQISILSELARRRGGVHEGAGEDPLDKIGELSRGLVDSMSDIVWATDPKKDRLGDLTQRIRQFASEVLGGSGIDFEVTVEGLDEQQKLIPNVRRQVYLIFKEAVNNVVRHSRATEAKIRLEVDGGLLLLEVRDNGRGFDTGRQSEGHGLGSMRDRVESLGGVVDWDSKPGRTVMRMRIPYTSG